MKILKKNSKFCKVTLKYKKFTVSNHFSLTMYQIVVNSSQTP